MPRAEQRPPCDSVLACAALLLACACSVAPPANPPSTDSRPPLFGAPSPSTGLHASQCGPRCAAESGCFEARVFSARELKALRSRELSNPPQALAHDPYEDPAPTPRPHEVCAVTFEPNNAYRLDTFTSAEQAAAAGATVTHHGACGLCSSLQDLAVYAEHPDMTEPVRACGVRGMWRGAKAARACLDAMGFSEPCAQVWAYNLKHTRKQCLGPCLRNLRRPHHRPDGELNACLQCDEAESGPVFKAIAGRTRRNSALASALCRPCSEVQSVTHDYW